ncbi:hypothetical protein H1P_6490002 [Hyella patelloides LEGE 07179]|uniref:Uncharacterized protein n=1 Tax=Hyella patelloides LEGE 07179 TaxID=945734 RepID=A0A563W2E0_9CYAN|nr:hypothetical protein H1P_6490002 [Hyella patelloides LEGE 07179]
MLVLAFGFLLLDFYCYLSLLLLLENGIRDRFLGCLIQLLATV